MNSKFSRALSAAAPLALVIMACGSTASTESTSTPGQSPVAEEPSAIHAIERELRRAPLMSCEEFDPVDLIRITNRFHEVGPDGALIVLEKLCSIPTSDEQRLFLENQIRYRLLPVMRCLFVRKEGNAPLPRWNLGSLGATWDRYPAGAFERFPIAVVGDCPFLLASGYYLFGVPQDPNDQLTFCRLDCRLRDAPLAPTMSPLDAADALSAALRSEFGETQVFLEARLTVRRQALRAIQNIYPEGVPLESWSWSGPDDKRWAQIRNDVAALRLVWSASKQQFVATE